MDRLTKSVVLAYFSQIFYSNVCNVSRGEACARIEATIKERKIVLAFLNEACKELEQDVKILSKAFYLDNPFVLNRLNDGGAYDELEKYCCIVFDESGMLWKMQSSITLREGDKCAVECKQPFCWIENLCDQKMHLENHSLRERDVLILDEPEIHLHPEWQMK